VPVASATAIAITFGMTATMGMTFIPHLSSI
jgi:hypothetical protein